MQVVIHIGTHKTGTSTIQSVLANNRALLAEQGIHYPLCRYSGRNVNFLGWRLINKKYDEPTEFLQKAIRDAAARNCHTVLVSGESLYAMTSLFRNLMDSPVEDYWAQEQEAVQALASMLNGIEVKIVCYLRRQDLFLESLYNQFVKQAPGYSGDLKSFIDKAGPVSDYAGHLDVWGRVFGDDAVIVRAFDDVSGALLTDFVNVALGLDDVSAFKMPVRYINERLSTDLLQFKRIVNRLQLPLVEGFAAFRVISRMAQSETASALNTTLMTTKDRNALLAGYEAGNRKVMERYCAKGGDPLFAPPEDNGDIVASSALPVDRGLEIYMRFSDEMSRPGVRMEILLRTFMRTILARAPWLENVLGGVRRLVNQWRLRREWHGQK